VASVVIGFQRRNLVQAVPGWGVFHLASPGLSKEPKPGIHLCGVVQWDCLWRGAYSNIRGVHNIGSPLWGPFCDGIRNTGLGARCRRTLHGQPDPCGGDFPSALMKERPSSYQPSIRWIGTNLHATLRRANLICSPSLTVTIIDYSTRKKTQVLTSPAQFLNGKLQDTFTSLFLTPKIPYWICLCPRAPVAFAHPW